MVIYQYSGIRRRRRAKRTDPPCFQLSWQSRTEKTKQGRKLLCARLSPPICQGTSEGRIPGRSILEESPTAVILLNTMSIKYWLQSGSVCQVMFRFGKFYSDLSNFVKIHQILFVTIKFYSDLSNFFWVYQILPRFVRSFPNLTNPFQICWIPIRVIRFYFELSNSWFD